MITFQNVTKTYPGGTTAVNNLNLTVEEGSFTVFVGPSGCGKTTSMRMVNKMIDPTSGVIKVGGKDIANIPAVPHRLGIGYVLQHAGLLPHRNVLDNVAQVLRLKGVDKKTARSKAREALDRVSLDPALVDRYPAQLSGGQQQRVGVARALAADPPVLLMDEPFSAVDPVVREELQDEMLRLHRELKKTIIFVTHDIDEALRLGDKIAVFAPGGVMLQYAEPERVLTRPANDFVQQLLGRDRGFRSLSFRDALTFANGEKLPLTPLGPVVDGAHAVTPEWRLKVDASGVPKKWVDAAGKEFAVGTATRQAGGSLRLTLDSVLSSPGDFGLVVDAAGKAVGTIASRDVYALLDQK